MSNNLINNNETHELNDMSHIKKINEMSGSQETIPVNEWLLHNFTWTSENHKNLKFRLMAIMNVFHEVSFYGIGKLGNKIEKVITYGRYNNELTKLPMFKNIMYAELVAYSNTIKRLDVKIVHNDNSEELIPFDDIDPDIQIKIYDELVKSWKNCTKDIFKYYNEL